MIRLNLLSERPEVKRYESLGEAVIQDPDSRYRFTLTVKRSDKIYLLARKVYPYSILRVAADEPARVPLGRSEALPCTGASSTLAGSPAVEERVSSGAASKLAGTHEEGCTPASCPRPALSGWGATAAGASPPDSHQCETGLAGLALRAREVPAGVVPSRPVGASVEDGTGGCTTVSTWGLGGSPQTPGPTMESGAAHRVPGVGYQPGHPPVASSASTLPASPAKPTVSSAAAVACDGGSAPAEEE